MGRDFDSRFPRFRIGPHDRVVIEGRPYRLLQQTDDAFVLMTEDGAGLAETFRFEDLNALSAAGRVRHEIDHFMPPAMRPPRLGASGVAVAHLSARQRQRIATRHALVQGFKELWNAGAVLKTETSIARQMDRICDLARPYLEETADLEELDREARVASGQGRRRAGGTLRTAISPVHPRTLLGWMRAEEQEGKAGLVDGFAKRGNRTSRFSPEENALLATEVRRSHLSLNRPPIVTTFQDVKNAFRAENARRQDAGLAPLRGPSRKAIRRSIASLDAFEVAVARHGAEEAMKRFRPVGRGLEVARPLERVEIDEWRIDLISIMASAGLLGLFDAEERAALGLDDKKSRWWIVAAIDCRTRVILGMKLTRDPKASAAVACLRMITSDKGAISDATGAAGRWSQYGTPELLVADNGSAFKANVFTDACNDLGITLERAIAGVPAMRGTIERLFRTCATSLLPRLSGRTFSDVVERAGHDAEARACLGPEDLCFALVRWIVDIYHNTPHAGLGGRKPLAQWEADHREGNYPLRAAPDRRAKRLAIGLAVTRNAGREGVVVLGVRYHSQALAAFVVRRGPGSVGLRWDPEDLGVVDVRIDGAWQEVPAVHAGFDGLHAQLWIATRRALRTSEPRRKQWEEDAVAEAIEAIKAMNLQRSLQFQLIDKGYSAEALEQLENGMFDGFRVTATSPKLHASSDGHGRSIVPVAPEGAAPTDRPKGDDPADGPRGIVPVVPLLPRRKHDEPWSFDE